MPHINPSNKNKGELSREEIEYYSRQIVLTEIGYEGQLKLANAKICIVGLGGLGSVSATLLASMGVGYLRLVDRDIVELSNLHRQSIYGVDVLGYPKVEAAAKRLKTLNPYIQTELHPISLNEETVEKTIRGVDIVIDGLDRIGPRYVLNRACFIQKIPYIFGAAIETYGNLSTILPGKTPCLECFMSGLKDEQLPSCSVVGVHPSILAIISSLQVSEAIKIILGETPSLANKLLFCEMTNLSFYNLEISRRKNCLVCNTDGAPKSIATRTLVESICGRMGKPAFVITPRKNLALNMKKVQHTLEKTGYRIKIGTPLGITFEANEKATLSMLTSGVTIVEGIKDETEALKVFKNIMTDNLDIAWAIIE